MKNIGAQAGIAPGMSSPDAGAGTIRPSPHRNTNRTKFGVILFSITFSTFKSL